MWDTKRYVMAVSVVRDSTIFGYICSNMRHETAGLEFGKSKRAVENREKWRKLVAKSSMVPQWPSRLRDWWWWWWCQRSVCDKLSSIYRKNTSWEILWDTKRLLIVVSVTRDVSTQHALSLSCLLHTLWNFCEAHNIGHCGVYSTRFETQSTL